MQLRACHQCRTEILDDGIEHRRRLFCSDECCEQFEDLFMVRGEPDPQDLEAAEHGLDEIDLGAADLGGSDLDEDLEEELEDEDLDLDLED